jgi:hypothetical protein
MIFPQTKVAPALNLLYITYKTLDDIGEGMDKVYGVLVAILLLGASVSAQQVTIFGKVTDAKGAVLDSVVVRLAKHYVIADTTDKNGLFSLTGHINAAIAGIGSATTPFVQFSGTNVHFSVDRPTRIAVEVFTTAGRRLAKPLDAIVSPGSYTLPVAAGVSTQIVLVRVVQGSDVYIFRMQGARLRETAQGAAALTSTGLRSQQSSLSKSSTAAIDTLVFSRNGFITQTRTITSYTPADSIAVSLQSMTALKAKVIAAADSIMLAVQSFRGKNFKRSVFVSVYTRSQYTAIMGDQFDTVLKAKRDLYNSILRFEGLLRPAQDYFESSNALLSEGTAGFYVPGTDSLYVILSDTATGLAFEDSISIFHELVHALQDQYFDLLTIMDSTASTDRYYAGNFTIEGEATLLMNYYAFKLMTGAYPTSATKVVNYLDQQQTMADQELDSMHRAGDPLLASMPLIWEYYSYGPTFVNAISGMKWSTIDSKIFQRLPVRMLEVLHPQKYSTSNEYTLNVLSLENTLSNSNSLVDVDELGELMADVMFREWNFSSYQAIADGMMADNVIVYRGLQSDSLRMIWNTYWQDSAAAASFFTNYASLVDKKRNIQLPSPVNSGKYSYINDTRNKIYIERSKSYVFTLENYQTSSLNNDLTLCRAIQPYKNVALAKAAAGQESNYPRVNKHRRHGGRPHPVGRPQHSLR